MLCAMGCVNPDRRGAEMARTKAVLGAGTRLSDYLSASLLAQVYPAEHIAIIATAICKSKLSEQY